MNNIRWKELGMPTNEGEMQGEIQKVKEFLHVRADFLQSIWVKKEKYQTVKVKFDGGSAEFLVKPGETFAKELSQTVPFLQSRAFFSDPAYATAFDTNAAITADITLYMSDENMSDTQCAVLVVQSNGTSEGFWIKSGTSLWESVLQKRTSLQNRQFYSDSAHTVLFDVYAPIVTNTTLHLRTFDLEKNQNLIFFIVLSFLGIGMVFVEFRKTTARKRWKD